MLTRFRCLALVLFASVSVILPLSAAAQSAALLNGGSRAFLALSDGKSLDVNLTTGAFRPFPAVDYGLPASFTPGATSNAGQLIGKAGRTVYACDLEKRKAVRLYEAPTTASIEALAYNPKNGGVLVQLLREEKPGTPDTDDMIDREVLIYVPKDLTKTGYVFSRRVSEFRGMTFAADGTFYFATHGDIWAGAVEEYGPVAEEYPPFLLRAERVAPVATPETYEGTPSGIGADALAASGGYLYFHAGRMGGSGWGNTARMKIPNFKATEQGGLAEVTRRSTAWLSTLEVLGDQADGRFLCSSPDGRHVLYLESGVLGDQGDQPVLTLIEEGKPPRQVKLTPAP